MTGQAAAGSAVFVQADAAVAAGDLITAARLIEEVLAQEDTGHGLEGWLKLAGLRRALRQPRKALEAVHGALRHAPLDFVALCLRAGLLEKLDPDHAGEAWAEALAQRPDGPVPPGMAAAIAAGEGWRDRWEQRREARLAEATPRRCRAGIGGPGVEDRPLSQQCPAQEPGVAQRADPLSLSWAGRAGIPPARALSLAGGG